MTESNQSVLGLERIPPRTSDEAPKSIGDVPLANPAGPPEERTLASAERGNAAPAGAQAPAPQSHPDRAAPEPASTPAAGDHNGNDLGSKRRPSRESQPGRPRGTGGLWAVLIILVLPLAGVIAYGDLALKQNQMSLAQLPNLQQLLSTLKTRADSTEAQLRDLTSNWSQLSDRVSQLDRSLNALAGSARAQTERLVAQAEQRLQDEINQRNQQVDERLARLEADQNQQKAQLAQVRGQLQQQIAAVRDQVLDNRDSTARDLSRLNAEASRSQGQLQTLARRMDPERVDFEVEKNAARDLVPGITLRVTHTEVSYQRYNGYLSLANEGRTLWLSNVGAGQSVAFYPETRGSRYDLIVTRVTPSGVAGYLLVPRNEGSGSGGAPAATPSGD